MVKVENAEVPEFPKMGKEQAVKLWNDACMRDDKLTCLGGAVTSLGFNAEILSGYWTNCEAEFLRRWADALEEGW